MFTQQIHIKAKRPNCLMRCPGVGLPHTCAFEKIDPLVEALRKTVVLTHHLPRISNSRTSHLITINYLLPIAQISIPEMADTYLELIKQRHTKYTISSDSPISDTRLQEVISQVLRSTPSSFNCQSTRYVVLLREDHIKFWEIAKECFRATMSESQYAEYEKKLLGRQAGFGTVSQFQGNPFSIEEVVLTTTDLAIRRYGHHSRVSDKIQSLSTTSPGLFGGEQCNPSIQSLDCLVIGRVWM